MPLSIYMYEGFRMAWKGVIQAAEFKEFKETLLEAKAEAERQRRGLAQMQKIRLAIYLEKNQLEGYPEAQS